MSHKMYGWWSKQGQIAFHITVLIHFYWRTAWKDVTCVDFLDKKIINALQNTWPKTMKLSMLGERCQCVDDTLK